VNQVISIPGGAGTDIVVVQTITNDTSLVVWTAPTATASGQTATRKNEYVAIPTGLGGMYLITVVLLFGTQASPSNSSGGVLKKNAVGTGIFAAAGIPSATSNTTLCSFTRRVRLAAGEFVFVGGFNNNGTTALNVKGGTTGPSTSPTTCIDLTWIAA
jgi:hypothetical protein